jgi:hypothetical protein
MTQKSPLKIADVPVADLKPAPYNPRDISEVAFEGLKESIKKFGFVDPVIVNVRTGLMVGGHQRLKAALALGLASVPAVHVDLSPSEEKALNVTLNNQRISGHYTDALQELLGEIAVDLGEAEMAALKLDELVVPDGWGSDTEQVEDTEENLDGIQAKIVVRCPQPIADEVRIYIQRKLLETAFEGVTLG